jgi:hypothetical protein
MLDTLIHLLQEVSERVCGTALPTEICRIILVQWAGMRSPSAQLLVSCMKKGSEWDFIEAVILANYSWSWTTPFDPRFHPTVDYRPCAGSGEWHESNVASWAVNEIDNYEETQPLWPYVSEWARLVGVRRGDRPKRYLTARACWLRWGIDPWPGCDPLSEPPPKKLTHETPP